MAELFTQLLGYLKDLGLWLLDKLVEGLTILGNTIIELIATTFSFLVGLLPDSIGFNLETINVPSGLAEVLSWVNWFFPVDTMILCLGAYLSVLLAWFVIRPVLSFIQVW